MSEFTPKGYEDESKPSIDPEAVARAKLDRGERLIWIGQPLVEQAMAKAFIVYPFALLWTSFAVFWTAMAYTMTRADESAGAMAYFFPLFGLPFILIGVGMLCAPFLARSKARKVVYAITDKRAFVLLEGKQQEIRNYPFSDWDEEITTKKKKDGSGSVLFAWRAERSAKGRTRMRQKGFEYIKNVESVERKLRRALSDYKAQENMMVGRQ